MIRINFYVSCFDRYLVIDVESDKRDKACEILNEAYTDWHECVLESEGVCCEEYLLYKLFCSGIEYVEIES